MLEDLMPQPKPPRKKRVVSKPMANNKSGGLLGIWFDKRLTYGKYPHWNIAVLCAVPTKDKPKRNTSFSLRNRRPDEALALAFAARVALGLRVPPLREALAAFERWLQENPIDPTFVAPPNPQPGKPISKKPHKPRPPKPQPQQE